MTWGMIGGAAVSVVGGSLLNSSGGSSSGATAAADPFASQRPQYQQMLQKLMTDPSSFTQSAGSQVATKAGMAALDANAASKGLAVSGSQEQALTKYATDQTQTDYYNQLNLLSTLSGATSGNTGAASGAIQSANNSATAALGTLGSVAGTAISNAVSGSSGTDMTGFQTSTTPSWVGSSVSSGVTNTGGALGSGTADFSNLLQTFTF